MPNQTYFVEQCEKQAEEWKASAEFWASLTNHRHSEKGEEICDAEDCFEAWEMYPDG